MARLRQAAADHLPEQRPRAHRTKGHQARFCDIGIGFSERTAWKLDTKGARDATGGPALASHRETSQRKMRLGGDMNQSLYPNAPRPAASPARQPRCENARHRHAMKISAAVVAASLFWATAAFASPPPYPVLFVHGLTGSADRTWSDALSYFESEAGWGPAAIVTADVVSTPPGHLYALNFSDHDDAKPSQNLTFAEQGGELASAVAAILAANYGVDRVILAGHSMGGVASRFYIEGLGEIGGQAISYGGDVAALITIGTPHAGTPVADTCIDLEFLCDAFLDFFDPPLGADSTAMKSLRTDSPEIAALNAPAAVASLPTDIVYRSVIGNGQSVPVVLETDSDGVVPADSQNLANIPGTAALDHAVTTLDYSSAVGVGHLQQGSDPRFFAEILALVDELSVCGNGVAEGSEGCDDANATDADGCSTSCRLEACGDPMADPPASIVVAQAPTTANLVTASDALFVLRSATGGQSCALCVCDANDDQAVTATDALAILLSAVGGGGPLSCPAC
jgi:cysteine-rich repeat protein